MKRLKFLGVLLISFIIFNFNVYATDYKEVDNFVAFKDAILNGESVKITEDFKFSEPITITGENIVIDLNGKQISYDSSIAGEAMIINKGNLTIKDSTNTNAGKILFTYIGQPDTSYGKGNYTISNVGTLVLESGTIENATAKMSHACYAIDNNANGNNINLTINGGKVINTYNYAIRQLSAGKDNTININGGTVTGTRAIWIQLAGSDTSAKPNMTLNITGGKLIGTGESATYKLAIYSYNYGNSLENVKINITGGTLDGDLALTGGKNKEVSEKVNITGGSITNVYSYASEEVTRIEIKGGTFGFDISDYVVEGYRVAEKNDLFVVAEEYTSDLKEIDTKDEVKDVTVGITDLEYTENVLLDSISNDDIKDKINGQPIKVEIEVSDIKEDKVNKDIKNKIENKAGDAVIATYFDITIAVKNSVTLKNITTITNLTDEIELVILLPESLRNLDNDIEREYFVIREHDGKVEKIAATLSKDGKYLTFKSKLFSTYALAYQDTLIDNTDTDTTIKNPQTLDSITTYILMGTISAISFVGICYYIKKKNLFN